MATVDENGTVTPLKNGKIVLTATATDASGISTTKSIVVTVSVRANTITSDIGVWDKEFNSDITEYTVYVPVSSTHIRITSKFVNASAKINGSPIANNIAKKITLDEENKVLEMTLTPQSGNTLKANTYKINIVKFEGTKTTVFEDKKSFTVNPINIENGKTVILALYDGDKFVETQSSVYNGSSISFTTDKAYTVAKVMVWNDLDDLTPVCDAEILH